MPGHSEDQPPIVCRRILFRGRVQGVGFRYTAYSLARRCPITGFVKNLPDGRVELVIEGTESDVEAYAGRLAERMGDNIDGCGVDELPSTGSFRHFEIRY